jgi:CelD/BcsL family acetyltransferase involved in cellulose biosynthesis
MRTRAQARDLVPELPRLPIDAPRSSSSVDAAFHVTTGERVEVLRGRHELQRNVRDIEALALRCGAPATARMVWVMSSLQAAPDQASWSVVIRDADDTVCAAVVLLDLRAGAIDLVTLAGTAVGQRGALLVHDIDHAELLGRAVGNVLLARGRHPYVDLGMLPAGDPRVEAFALGLPGARVQADAPIPVIDATGHTNVTDFLSHNMRRQMRKATNRIETDGLKLSVALTCDAHEILEQLPQLADYHRGRDHAHGRASHLDDIPGRLMWESRVRGLAEAGVLEMATLSLDGRLAAYTFAILDAPSYRLLEGRFVSAWSRYSPGRILEAAVVQRVLDDPTLHQLDWMSAVADEKLLAANAADPVVAIRVAGH